MPFTKHSHMACQSLLFPTCIPVPTPIPQPWVAPYLALDHVPSSPLGEAGQDCGLVMLPPADFMSVEGRGFITPAALSGLLKEPCVQRNAEMEGESLSLRGPGREGPPVPPWAQHQGVAEEKGVWLIS